MLSGDHKILCSDRDTGFVCHRLFKHDHQGVYVTMVTGSKILKIATINMFSGGFMIFLKKSSTFLEVNFSSFTPVNDVSFMRNVVRTLQLVLMPIFPIFLCRKVYYEL